MNTPSLSHAFGKIDLVEKSSRVLWRYKVKSTGRVIEIAPPRFEVGDKEIVASLVNIKAVVARRKLSNGAVESIFVGDFAKAKGLQLKLIFRVVPNNPIVRFQYQLLSRTPVALTKQAGRDHLDYFKYSVRGLGERKEIRVSEFDESIHSFRLIEREVNESAFANALDVMGPILVASGEKETVLAAYEHGSQSPDAYVQFQLAADQSVTVRAVKGNYYRNRVVDAGHPFETIWFEFAAIKGSVDDLARSYREFVLRHMTLNASSRKPYLFYNTWNFQERNYFWNGTGSVFESMNEKRMLAEIDVAHKMGIDVFVIDAGWYQKTGDWEVNCERFSANLSVVKARLDEYGMKLGLWFSPTESAVNGRLTELHASDRMSKDGKLYEPNTALDPEGTHSLCIVSSYWESFANELIRLSKEVGVVYFKWDAVGQYGCNDPRHHHGGEDVSECERGDCYAFEQIRYMQRVVDKLCQACPEAIVDFDITEGRRSVGLAFLASGKYFLINNGPYFFSIDYPKDKRGIPPGMWHNVYVFPGAARPRICRAPLDFDKWIPSVLFLTHYLPDDPESSQWINLASLVLGQNGIWGDLLTVSKEGVERFGKILGRYKLVRDDITKSDPVRSGVVGGSPEVHEKILAATGRGVLSLFTASPGKYTYITENKVAKKFWTHDGVTITRLKNGRARIDFETREFAAARMVFFGVV